MILLWPHVPHSMKKNIFYMPIHVIIVLGHQQHLAYDFHMQYTVTPFIAVIFHKLTIWETYFKQNYFCNVSKYMLDLALVNVIQWKANSIVRLRLYLSSLLC